MAGPQTYMNPSATMTPYDPNRGLPYGTEAVQKMIGVTLDAFFTDSVGATCSRVMCVGADGNVNLLWGDGTSTVVPMIAGLLYPYRAFKVLSTNTTATGILWGY